MWMPMWTPAAWAEDTEVACARVAAVQVPAADQPTDAEKASLAGCDSEALYYGIGVPADPERARKCALLERATGSDGQIAGAAILVMVYGNGVGAARNVDLAVSLACEQGAFWAEAERDGRVQHLLTLGPADRIDFCDDITSGMMQGVCTAHQKRIDDVDRAERRTAALNALTPAQRAAWPALESAADAFFSQRSDAEVDQSGTGRAAFVIEERTELENGLLRALEQAKDPAFPPRATAADFKKADRELNAVYGQLMKRKGFEYGTVTLDGIRETERAWIAYRDAWVAFGAVVRPEVPAEAWKTWATVERTKQLGGF